MKHLPFEAMRIPAGEFVSFFCMGVRGQPTPPDARPGEASSVEAGRRLGRRLPRRLAKKRGSRLLREFERAGNRWCSRGNVAALYATSDQTPGFTRFPGAGPKWPVEDALRALTWMPERDASEVLRDATDAEGGITDSELRRCVAHLLFKLSHLPDYKQRERVVAEFPPHLAARANDCAIAVLVSETRRFGFVPSRVDDGSLGGHDPRE